MTTADMMFVKAKLGHHRGSPAVIVSDRTGAPFLWITGPTHGRAIADGIRFCDAALAEVRP